MDVQVIDTEGNTLQNVITFPPEGAFIVNSSIDVEGPQRVNFKFNGALVKFNQKSSLPLPPFGQGKRCDERRVCLHVVPRCFC
jgi:hypothetical protein